MQTTFFVSHAGQTYGPWTVAEITQRIAQMELIATDYLFDDASGAWVPLMEHQAVVSALRSQKPTAPPPGKPTVDRTAKAPEAAPQAALQTPSIPSMSGLEDASSENAEWFVQKDTHRYGPFTYMGLVKALQEKSIFDFDLVWRKGMEKWVRVAEHEMFTAEAIRGLKTKAARESSKFFFERQFPRLPIQTEVIVHDNKSVWLGQTYQGSEGGSGVNIRNALLIPGQVLYLHFTAFEGIPAFNALCEVVSKRYVPNVRDSKAAVPYGVKFVKIDPEVKDALREYYESKGA